jgi:hypothetical protein
LNLCDNERLLIRDAEGTREIAVRQEFTMSDTSVLEIVLADTEWGSTLHLDLPYLAPAEIDGTLRLTFAAEADVPSLVGRSFHLFDWHSGLRESDAFARIDYPTWTVWDLSDLYDGGTVTLLLIPEPGALGLLLLTVVALRRR